MLIKCIYTVSVCLSRTLLLSAIPRNPIAESSSVLLPTHGSAVLKWGGGKGRRIPRIILGTSPSTCHCLLCHPDSMTSWEEGSGPAAGAGLQIPKEAPDTLFSLAPRAGAGSGFEV